MKEARIILPKADNNGQSLEFMHKSLATMLCKAFGGATATDSHGMWVSPEGKLYDEPGTAYDVAMEDTAENAATMREIAFRFGRLAKQEAMYLRYASGKVEIVDTSAEMAAAAA